MPAFDDYDDAALYAALDAHDMTALTCKMIHDCQRRDSYAALALATAATPAPSMIVRDAP